MKEDQEHDFSAELPENAFRELKKDETYKPLLPTESRFPEVTPWSVSWGIVMAVLFSAAAAYLGLKVGQVFEAAIPIAIIAVGLSSASKRKNALGGKRHYTIHRRMFRCNCCRKYFYPAGSLHTTS